MVGRPLNFTVRWHVSWSPGFWLMLRRGVYAVLLLAAVLGLFRLWGPSDRVFANLVSRQSTEACSADTRFYGVARYMTRTTLVYCYPKNSPQRFVTETCSVVNYRSLTATIAGTAFLVAVCWVVIRVSRRAP